MPKYWGKQIFSLGSFPQVGQKQKTEKKREREKKKMNDGDNNGQATHGSRKHAWANENGHGRYGMKMEDEDRQ